MANNNKHSRIPDPYDFIQSIKNTSQDDSKTVGKTTRRTKRTFKLATIDPDYVSGSDDEPRVTFDGESTLTTRTFPHLASYSPRSNERVLMARVSDNDSYMILGSAEPDGLVVDDLTVGGDITLSGTFVNDLDVSGNITVTDGNSISNTSNLAGIDFIRDGTSDELRLWANDHLDFTNSDGGLIARMSNGGNSTTLYGDLDVDGDIDVGTSANRIHLETADQSGGNKFIVRTASNPPAGEPMFEVRSSGQAVRFSVEHSGATRVEDLVVGGNLFAWTSGSTIVLDNVNEIRADGGSSSDPAYTFTSNQNTGMYLAANGPVLTANGTWRLYCNGSKIQVRDDIELGTSGQLFMNASQTGDKISFASSSSQFKVHIDGEQEMLLGNTGAFIPNIYGRTTSGSANVNVGGTGGDLRRSTSSKRYKENIEPVRESTGVLMLTPSRFDGMQTDVVADENGRAIRDAEGRIQYTLIRTGKHHLGLIAEDVHEKIPDACIYDEEGKPDAIEWNSITAALIHEIKALKEQVEQLRSQGQS